MAQYIDKAAVIAEIEKLKAYLQIPNAQLEAIKVCDNVISVLNTLEVNEVDLEKEIEEVKHNYKVDDNRHTSICSADIEWIANHFFELGLKAQKGGEE